MPPFSPFTHTDPTLLPILHELRTLEPIFPTPEFGSTPADFAGRMAPGYWEIGASGRRYSRDFVLDMLAENPPIDATTARWRTSGHALRQLSPTNDTATYLLTYNLTQGKRLTRRSTLWQRSPSGWQILFHQGTIVSCNEDDSPWEQN